MMRPCPTRECYVMVKKYITDVKCVGLICNNYI